MCAIRPRWAGQRSACQRRPVFQRRAGGRLHRQGWAEAFGGLGPQLRRRSQGRLRRGRYPQQNRLARAPTSRTCAWAGATFWPKTTPPRPPTTRKPGSSAPRQGLAHSPRRCRRHGRSGRSPAHLAGPAGRQAFLESSVAGLICLVHRRFCLSHRIRSCCQVYSSHIWLSVDV